MGKWDGNIKKVIMEGTGKNVGASSTKFWEDCWLGDGKLMNAYPRLYSISLQRQELIYNMGFWDGYEWRWNFMWRRELFEWEKEEFSGLMASLNGPHFGKEDIDLQWWRHNLHGKYSVKSFTEAVFRLKHTDTYIGNDLGKGFWRGIVPPNVELFVWFVVLGKVNTKERLVRLGILGEREEGCTF